MFIKAIQELLDLFYQSIMIERLSTYYRPQFMLYFLISWAQWATNLFIDLTLILLVIDNSWYITKYLTGVNKIFLFVKYKGKVRIKGLNINKSFNLVKKVERNEEKKRKKERSETQKAKLSSYSRLQSVRSQSVWMIAVICKWLITVAVDLVNYEKGPCRECTENYSSSAPI